MTSRPTTDWQKTYLDRTRKRRMDDDMLADQRRLVELVETEGWEVTDLELSAYDSPWADEDDPEATVTITARKPYEGDAEDDEESDDSPFRVN